MTCLAIPTRPINPCVFIETALESAPPDYFLKKKLTLFQKSGLVVWFLVVVWLVMAVSDEPPTSNQLGRWLNQPLVAVLLVVLEIAGSADRKESSELS